MDFFFCMEGRIALNFRKLDIQHKAKSELNETAMTCMGRGSHTI